MNHHYQLQQPPRTSSPGNHLTSPNNRQIPLTCAGHTRPVVQLQFSHVLDDGNYLLISACKDGNPMLRIGDTGDWIGTFSGHKGAVWCARLSEDAIRAVTASADFTVKVWDTYSGGVYYTFPHKHIVRSVDISPDGRWVVSGGNEKILRVFDVDNPEILPKETKAHNATIKVVLWDAWRGVILSAADEKDIKVWNAENLELVHTMETLDPVASLSLSDDGEVIQAAAGKSVYFWSAQTYQLACRIDTSYDLSCVALHPLRDRFVCGSRTDTWVRVFEFPTGEELEVYKGHHGPVHATAYSPDGQLYATGSEDGTIRLWQTIPGTEYGLWQIQDDNVIPEEANGCSVEHTDQMMASKIVPEEEELMRMQQEEEFIRQQQRRFIMAQQSQTHHQTQQHQLQARLHQRERAFSHGQYQDYQGRYQYSTNSLGGSSNDSSPSRSESSTGAYTTPGRRQQQQMQHPLASAFTP